ncbi:hypothetical protein M0812_27014 [Anaeramoeba flamelloides]|uniref:Uncharacterized protein n=1 Tax=Anaeramoeba flamelloides TaxID=1746091 RepID=A0AAV7YFH0_9EUKA|nr:hypothetical protein M0812_27014 [Anaeramoeba flamelloides]
MNRSQWNNSQSFYPNHQQLNYPQLQQYLQNPNQNQNQLHSQQIDHFRSNPNPKQQQQQQQQQQNQTQLQNQRGNLVLNQQPKNPQRLYLSRSLPIDFQVPYPRSVQQQAQNQKQLQNQNHQFWKEIEDKQNKKISTVPSSQWKQNQQQQQQQEKKKKTNNKQKQIQKQKHQQQQQQLRKRKPTNSFKHPKHQKKKKPLMPRRRNQKKNHKYKKKKTFNHLLADNCLAINSPNVDLKEKNKYRLSAPKNSTSRLIPRKRPMILHRSDSTSGFFIDENGSFETLIDSSIFDSPLVKTILDENFDIDEKQLKEKVCQTDQFQEQLKDKEIKSKNLYHRMLLNYIKTLRNQNEELGYKLITATDELLELKNDNNEVEQNNENENENETKTEDEQKSQKQNKLENKLKNEIEIKDFKNTKNEMENEMEKKKEKEKEKKKKKGKKKKNENEKNKKEKEKEKENLNTQSTKNLLEKKKSNQNELNIEK